MAIQVAAEGALKGKTHSMNPDVRGARPPGLPPPGITAARPLSPCALPSNTLRKQRTCLASPAETARHASMTAPSWDGSSSAPVHQFRFRRSASKTSTTPAPENPGGVSMAPG